MNKSFLFTALTVLVAGTAMVSCSDDDKVSTSPVFGDINVTPEVLYTGQYGYATVDYQSSGTYIYSSIYYYNMTSGSSSSWTVVDPTTANPSFRFQCPTTSGNYTLTFGAERINYSATGSNGTLYGSASAVTKTIRVLVADALNANWGDTKEHLDSVLSLKDSLEYKVWTDNDVVFGNEEESPDLTSVRLYSFDSNDLLCKVEETATYKISSLRTWVEDSEGNDQHYDTLYNDAVNHVALYSILSVAELEDFEVTSYEVSGDSASVYTYDVWNKAETATEMATIVNAFADGLLKYNCVAESDKSICNIEIKCDDKTNLVFTRTFTPKE